MQRLIDAAAIGGASAGGRAAASGKLPERPASETPSRPQQQQEQEEQPRQGGAMFQDTGRDASERGSLPGRSSGGGRRVPPRVHSADALQPAGSGSGRGESADAQPRRSSSQKLSFEDAQGGDLRSSAAPSSAAEASLPHGSPPKAVHARQEEDHETDFLGMTGDGGTAASVFDRCATAQAPDVQEEDHDLLGMSSADGPWDSKPAAAGATGSQGAADLLDFGGSGARVQAAADEDILGMFAAPPPAQSPPKQPAGSSASRTAQRAAPPSGAPSAAASPAPPARGPAASSGLEELFGVGSHRAAGDSMIDFGDEAPAAGAAAAAASGMFTAPGDADVEGEPEVRAQAQGTGCCCLMQ